MATQFDEACKEFLVTWRRLMPEYVYEFVENHEWNYAIVHDHKTGRGRRLRQQAVYSCSLEDVEMIEDGEKECIEWIDSAISWAYYVQNFGDYETREEWHHGTDEEWEFEVEKSNEWIGLLKRWKLELEHGIHYIITSIGLIPEVSLYKTKEAARKAWFDNLEDNIEDIEESWKSGFAEYDDYEFRYGMEMVE